MATLKLSVFLVLCKNLLIVTNKRKTEPHKAFCTKLQSEN